MTVEEAIPLAIERVKSLFGGTEHRLEEVESKSDGDWEVTISYRSQDSPRHMTLEGGSWLSGFYQGKRTAIGVDPSRTYKDVLVSKDGQVKAVRMRQIVVG